MMVQTSRILTPDRPSTLENSAYNATKTNRLSELASRIVFWIAAFLGLIYLFLKSYEMATSTVFLTAQEIDFLVFWGAAQLALAGDALSAFDPATLVSITGFPLKDSTSFVWLYPPAYLLLITPLGTLPFWAAWTVFVLASAASLAMATRHPARELPGGWRLFIASPVVMIGSLAIGQTSVLWTAALIAALWAMRRDRAAVTTLKSEMWAGIWIALLTLKPQLGLLIPIALLAGRQWRVLAWASAWTLAIILASTLAFGPAYWTLFFSNLGEATSLVEQGKMPLPRMTSFYGFARAIGADHAAAIWAQLAMSIAIATAIAWIWSRKHLGYDLKFAALCAAIPLATPYAFYYEMTLAVGAALFLARDGFGTGFSAKMWLLVLWFGPVPILYLPILYTTSPVSIAIVAAPILIVTTVICLIRAWHRGRSSRTAVS